MLKKSVLLGMLLAVFLLAGLTLPGTGQAFENAELDAAVMEVAPDRAAPDPADLTYDYHMLTIPYNVLTGAWWTGINLLDYYPGNDHLKLEFYNNGELYATRYLTTSQYVDITSTIQGLLPARTLFRSPTTLRIYSEKFKFFGTQITSDGEGFSVQTLHSYPYAGPYWPHWNPAVY